MDKAIQLFLAGEEKNFLVFDEWQNLVAVLPEHRTAHALQSADGRAPVSQYMLHELLPLSEKESLSVSLKRLQSSQGGALPVYNEWHALVGILDTPSMDRHMRNLHRRA
jgi:predicted transcriptional regulator